MSLLLVNCQWSHIGFMLIRTGPNAVSTKSIKHYKRTWEWQHQVYPGVEEYTLRWSCELWLSKQPRRALCKWECKCTSSVSHSSSMEFYSSCALYTQGMGGPSLWPHCFAPIPTTGTTCCCSQFSAFLKHGTLCLTEWLRLCLSYHSRWLNSSLWSS